MAAAKQDRAALSRAGKLIMATLSEQVLGVLREAPELPTKDARWIDADFALPAGGEVRVSLMLRVTLPEAPPRRPELLRIAGPK